MLKIGLTGGIGSGKSTVAKIFEVLGIPVYYADDRAKFLMNHNATIQAKITEAFGSEVYENGILNRKLLSAKVFANPENTAIINNIVHPITIADAESWMLQQTTPYAVKEAALIFEAHAEKGLDLIIGVTAPEAVRIKRTMQRDGITENEVKARIAKQIDDHTKMQRCDFVIINDGSTLIIPQVIHINHTILQNIERLHH